MARRRRGVLKFKELAARLNGVQIPVFGVSWTPPEPERKVIREVLTFLEDRRALYNDFAHEIDHEVVQSVMEIRRVLTDAIARLSEGAPAIPALRAMRAACREYLDQARDFLHRFDFMVKLGRLRTLFGLQVAYLAIEYGLDVEHELAGIIPPELREDVDAERARD
jgi:Family of unknown function (DUF6650)